MLLLLLLGIGVELWKYRVGRWTMPVVAGNALLDIAVLAFVLLLVNTQQVVNPAFAEVFETETGGAFSHQAFASIVILGTLTVCVWDIIDSIVKYRRSSHRPPGKA